MFNPATSGNHKGADWPMGFFPCMKNQIRLHRGGFGKRRWPLKFNSWKPKRNPKSRKNRPPGFKNWRISPSKYRYLLAFDGVFLKSIGHSSYSLFFWAILGLFLPPASASTKCTSIELHYTHHDLNSDAMYLTFSEGDTEVAISIGKLTIYWNWDIWRCFEIWRCFDRCPKKGGSSMGPPPSPHPDTAKELLHVQQENTEHHLNIRGFPWLYHPTKWQSPLLVPGAPKSIAWACTAGHASDGGRFCWRKDGFRASFVHVLGWFHIKNSKTLQV